jgi:hypothetical protein
LVANLKATIRIKKCGVVGNSGSWETRLDRRIKDTWTVNLAPALDEDKTKSCLAGELLRYYTFNRFDRMIE